MIVAAAEKISTGPSTVTKPFSNPKIIEIQEPSASSGQRRNIESLRGGDDGRTSKRRRGGSPWGMLWSDVKKDFDCLLHTEESNQKTDVLHECFMNYGSVMFGRF